MSNVTIAREEARAADGRFGVQEHSAPEMTLTAGQALSMVAANSIRIDAPIGATRASLVQDERTGHIRFSRYVDRNGRTVPTDLHEDFNDSLYGANIDAFAAQPGVTVRDIDGETWFDVDVED